MESWTPVWKLCLNSYGDICNRQVRLGEHHFKQTEGYEQDINITSVTKHGSYVAASYDRDIAVIKLASPARFNDRVAPVCLQSNTTAFPPGMFTHHVLWLQAGDVSGAAKDCFLWNVCSEKQIFRRIFYTWGQVIGRFLRLITIPLARVSRSALAFRLPSLAWKTRKNNAFSVNGADRGRTSFNQSCKRKRSLQLKFVFKEE